MPDAQNRFVIAHVVFRFDVGGLENGVVNLINNTSEQDYSHVIICVEGYSPTFVKRVQRQDCPIFSLDKAPGKDIAFYFRLWRLLRKLKPDLVHARNIGTIDCLPVAAAAGVPARIYGEHGWDVLDNYGANRKYRWLRRSISLCAQRYIAVSSDIASWLRDTVGIADTKLVLIHNGVDTQRFKPGQPDARASTDVLTIGAAGRFAEVKDPLNLVQAFIVVLQRQPALRGKLRLLMLGDGDLYDQALARLRHAGLEEYVELPGAVDDVDRRFRQMDVFVLPSRQEGISNTILEAMATALPIVATRVGGTPELVDDNETGTMVPPGDPEAIADALAYYIDNPALARAHGEAGRKRVANDFSLAAMANAYSHTYQSVLGMTNTRRTR